MKLLLTVKHLLLRASAATRPNGSGSLKRHRRVGQLTKRDPWARREHPATSHPGGGRGQVDPAPPPQFLTRSPPLLLPSPSHLHPLFHSNLLVIHSFTATHLFLLFVNEPNYSWTQFSSPPPPHPPTLLGSEGRLGKWNACHVKNVLEHHNVGPDASSNADNRRVPICNLGAFSGTGVNKDPQPNIDRVYVSRLHIFFPALDAFEDQVGKKKKKKGERGSKENVNADKKKGRNKSTMLTEKTLERHMKALQALPSSKASHRKDLFQGFA